jgi:hypothetical protein
MLNPLGKHSNYFDWYNSKINENKTQVMSLEVDGSNITDTIKICNVFNNYFSSIVDTLDLSYDIGEHIHCLHYKKSIYII